MYGKLSELERRLVERMEGFEVIDCHEHLPPESHRTGAEVDAFTFFSHYTSGDLRVAGMPQEQYRSLFDTRIPLNKRWETLKPFWEKIRFTSYSRAVLIAMKKFYGFDDLNDATYQPLSEAMAKANTPGIYERVLRDACKIKTALTQCGTTELGTPLLTPVMPMVYETERAELLIHPPFDREAKVRSLDDYLDAVRRYVKRVKSEGTVGLKMRSNPYRNPDRKEALSAFESLVNGSVERLPSPNPLCDYVVDETIKIATEEELVICVHTGYWGDFRTLDPLHIIPILQRHPETKFDLYHLGYPWLRETLMLGKGFHNVWLNLCWTHIISQRFAMDGVDEGLDLIPTNKILAFGGDYGKPVEKVYGHLIMARENIARVMARRIEHGLLTEDQALHIARMWFFDNPAKLYRLKL